MALNPMQRKSRNSFLLGMLITLILAGAGIGFLIYQMNIMTDKLKFAESGVAYVLAEDVKSGQSITEDMLIDVKIHPNMQSDDNLMVIEKLENGTAIAKVDIAANTPLASSMIDKADEVVKKDVRLEEYNMLQLPSTLQNGEYIDVRLTLPTGQDYIVISKKQVKSCDLSTIWIEVSEDEITTMNNAIIENYIMVGSKLYVTRYVEPGLQEAATPTYPVSQAVAKARSTNPNILQEAIQAYNDRVAANDPTQDRNYIEQELSKYSPDKKDNVEKGVEESALKALEAREDYIDALETYK